MSNLFFVGKRRLFHRAKYLFLISGLIALIIAIYLFRVENMPKTKSPVHSKSILEAPQKITFETEQAELISANFISLNAPTPPQVSRPSHDPLLRLNFAALAARADYGDAHAACLLTAIIPLCGAPTDLKSLERDIIVYSAEGELNDVVQRDAVARLLRLEAFEPRRQKLCENVGQEQLAQSEQRTLQAARLGVPLAATRYFLTPGKMTDAAGKTDNNRLTEYQREALPRLEGAARRGNVAALFWLFWIYSNGRYHAGATTLEIPIDRAKAVATGMELVAISNPWEAARVSNALKKIEAEMTPNDWARAREIAPRYRVARSSWDLSDSQEPDQQLAHCAQ